ncbi:MAG: hypothetical protein JNN15_13715 [Blastocatellia bacterium]|nr:hypothetical protein [Blastocatellia bacterium]
MIKIRCLSQVIILLIMWKSITLAFFDYSHNISGAFAKIDTVCSVNKSDLSKVVLLTKHSPKLNGKARIKGSVRVLLAEAFNISGNVVVTGDIYVPGSPKIKNSPNATYQGAVTGDGDKNPNNYTIKLSGNSRINRIVTCTDGVNLGAIPAIIQTQGTRDLFLIKGDKPGDFSTVRDITLTKRYNLLLEIPEGSYGNFRADRRSGFILGMDNKETVYNLQSLELNSDAVLQIKGKVIINVRNGITLNSNAKMGDIDRFANLSVNVESGTIKLNSNAEFYGLLNAPTGTLILNSNSKLIGSVICDKAMLNSNSLLKDGI